MIARPYSPRNGSSAHRHVPACDVVAADLAMLVRKHMTSYQASAGEGSGDGSSLANTSQLASAGKARRVSLRFNGAQIVP